MKKVSRVNDLMFKKAFCTDGVSDPLIGLAKDMLDILKILNIRAFRNGRPVHPAVIFHQISAMFTRVKHTARAKIGVLAILFRTWMGYIIDKASQY